jgi:hypothetical protein
LRFGAGYNGVCRFLGSGYNRFCGFWSDFESWSRSWKAKFARKKIGTNEEFHVLKERDASPGVWQTFMGVKEIRRIFWSSKLNFQKRKTGPSFGFRKKLGYLLKGLSYKQCCGSMTFWCGSGSGSADPCL